MYSKTAWRIIPVNQKQALSIGIGIVDHQVIDRINILQATIFGNEEVCREFKYSTWICTHRW